jgi:Carboxypeptidase regulatory-like domain
MKVEDQGHPVKSLRVEIVGIKGGGSRAEAITDNNGFAFFRGVKAGSYHLSADHDAGIADGVDLDVTRDGPTNITVPLKWPNTAPVPVRYLKGIIRVPGYVPGQPQSELSLDVLEGSSVQSRKTLRTNARGEFNSEDAAPGLYFLRLKPSGVRDWAGEQITGLIAVVVDRNAAVDHLDLDLTWSSCGLNSADQSKCPHNDLHTGRLAGQVMDPAGAVISFAKIILLDSTGTLAEELQSDRDGKFASTRLLPQGTCQLTVSSTGFTPFRGTLHAEPNSGIARPSLLTVRLGLFAACSGASSL